ncbi:MAG: helix-turn-helix transcriptional regulator [Acidimicrobiales bacterium]
MGTIRGGVEQSRERLIALLLLLQRAWTYGPLTQDEILRDLKVDEFPASGKRPRKVLAYEGTESTVRQKFERDKAKIRDLGFEIETVALDDGTVGYRIDPTSGYAPAIDFTSEERRVVKLALAFCGFGATGAFSVFHEVPASDGGLELSNYINPVVRALQLRRALSFEYFSTATRTRTVEPLVIDVFHGVTYLVARVRDSNEIKGYRFSRMSTMPVLLDATFEVDDATLEAARAWRPEFAKALKPIDVVVATNENYGELLLREYPNAVGVDKGNGVIEVRLEFDSPRAALRFVLECADRVRLLSPKSLKSEIKSWLSSVNRGEVPDVSSLHFEPHGGTDVLGETLRLLHAVYASDDGLRVSELSQRFSLSPQHVRLIMDRLVSLEPMAQATDGTGTFPAHVMKECDDWDDEANDDSIYRADFSDLPEGAEDPSPLMWRDLFELNIALREASRIYRVPAIFSAIEKIEDAMHAPLQVEMASNEVMLEQVSRACESHSQIKMTYTSGATGETSTRTIEPRELRILNGQSYVRAYCTTRGAWRTFRVDRMSDVVATSPVVDERPSDTVANWLTIVGEEGDEVVVIVRQWCRWLFETLPGAQWCALSNGDFAVKIRVSDRQFLDHLMLRAGPGAVIATPQHADAGRDLAERLRSHL